MFETSEKFSNELGKTQLTMEENLNSIEPLFEKVEQYGRTTFQLVKLEAIDKTSVAFSGLASGAIVWSILLLFMTSASAGLSLLIGELLGKNSLGFFCVAGAYLIIGIAYYFLYRKNIRNKIANYVIAYLLN